VAHRTSPTNIGLSLLANLSAFDFGYIYAGELIERTSGAFHTMSLLERYQGHFLNWYDTKTLNPLKPLYVSSVDSGNLAAHLITLKQGLLSVVDQPVTGPRLFEGINDSLNILIGEIGKIIPEPITRFRKYLLEVIGKPPQNLLFLQERLEKLTLLTAEIEKHMSPDSGAEYITWVRKLSLNCRNAFNELNYLTPWILHSHFSELSNKYPALNKVPTLREICSIIAEISKSGNTDFDDEAGKLFHLAVVHAEQRINTLVDLAKQADEFSKMKYDFLYDKSRHLQVIGYNVEDRRADSSYYDLEAALPLRQSMAFVFSTAASSSAM
jgi:hypothetical protein